MTPNLSRVVLSLPSLVSLATTDGTDGASRSWIQLARTGSFQSSRYGQFEITTDDLQMMAKNFRAATTPIDYDHLSNDPQRPGDGIAAGWLQRVELRDRGNTLWGLVDWTPDAAKHIADGEYRFISPSFMKDARDAFGNELGTKLIAAALTNMPFLPEMAAVTLGDEEVFGAFALSLPAETKAALHLAEVGQRLTFIENEEATPELSAQDRAQVFVVMAIGGGTGDDAFVKLKTAEGGQPFGWYPVKVLAPAPAPGRTTEEKTNMQTEANLEQLAAQFSTRVEEHYKNTGDWAKAFDLAQREDSVGAEAYRLAGGGGQRVEVMPAPTAINLSAKPGETLNDVAQRYANEHGVLLKKAVHEVSKARPDLAAAHLAARG